MKKIATKTRTQTYTVVEMTVCDICGKESRSDSWAVKEREINDVEIKHRSGYFYSDGGGGSVKEAAFDICPDCFKAKLIPWFESQGARPRTEESDL